MNTKLNCRKNRFEDYAVIYIETPNHLGIERFILYEKEDDLHQSFREERCKDYQTSTIVTAQTCFRARYLRECRRYNRRDQNFRNRNQLGLNVPWDYLYDREDSLQSS